MRNPALSRAFVPPKLMTKSGSDAYQARAKLRSKRDRFSSIFLTSGFFLRKPCGPIGSTWFPSVLLQSAQRTQRVNCLSSKICKNQSSWIENFKHQQEAKWKLGCQASAWWVNHLLTLYCAQSSELFTWHLKDCAFASSAWPKYYSDYSYFCILVTGWVSFSVKL